MRPDFEPEIVYHIYTHANGSENLFRSSRNYNYFLERYGYHIYPIAETYAYCLMPNHIHFMIRVRSKEEVFDFVQSKKKEQTPLTGISNIVSRQFSHLFNGYTQAYNKQYGRKGSLFMPKFKRKPVREDVYFTRLIAYIHNNPIKHGFAKNMFDWHHSSIHAYVLQKPSKLNRKYLEEWFGDKEALLQLHRSMEKEDIFFEFN